MANIGFIKIIRMDDVMLKSLCDISEIGVLHYMCHKADYRTGLLSLSINDYLFYIKEKNNQKNRQKLFRCIKSLEIKSLITKHNIVEKTKGVYSVNKNVCDFNELDDKNKNVTDCVTDFTEENVTISNRYEAKGNTAVTDCVTDCVTDAKNALYSRADFKEIKEVKEKDLLLRSMVSAKKPADTRLKYQKDSHEIKLCRKLVQVNLRKDPKFKYPAKNILDEEKAIFAMQAWAGEINKLLRIDERTFEEISAVIDYLERPDCLFIVESAISLRKKFGRIYQASQKPVKMSIHDKNMARLKKAMESQEPEQEYTIDLLFQ